MEGLGYLVIGIVLVATGMMWAPVSVHMVGVHVLVGAGSMAHAIFSDHTPKKRIRKK